MLDEVLPMAVNPITRMILTTKNLHITFLLLPLQHKNPNHKNYLTLFILKKSMASICVFGDSITEGCNDYKKGGWLEQLKRYHKIPNDEIFVYNCGIQGDSTREILERFESESESRYATAIIFALGINDSCYYNGDKQNNNVSVKIFQNNIEELIKKAKKLRAKIFFIGPTSVEEAKTQPIPWALETSISNEVIAQYNKTIKEVCSKYTIKFIEIFNLLSYKDLSDGLHPNTKGHEKIFEKVKDEIGDLLKC